MKLVLSAGVPYVLKIVKLKRKFIYTSIETIGVISPSGENHEDTKFLDKGISSLGKV